MLHFTPTLGIKDTAKNSKSFIKGNKDVFWAILKPLLPFIIVFSILDVFVTELLMPINKKTGEPYEFPGGGLIASYFLTCLAITWHRVVIHGPDNYESMNPFNPRKSELAFVGMGILLFMSMFLGGALIGFSIALIDSALLALLLVFLPLGLYLWTKFMFYFPAKATGRHITLGQSFKMTTGYVWKLLAASFLAYLKLLFIMFGLLILLMVLLTTVYAFGLPEAYENSAEIILISLFTLPTAGLIQPLFTVIWVTVLSNYYQYVMQNEQQPASKDETND